MVAAERLPNYRLNHVTPLDLNVATASPRVVVIALLHHVREVVVEESARCLKVTGFAQAVVMLSLSCLSNQGTPATSSVWIVLNLVDKCFMKYLFPQDTYSYKGWLNSDSFIKRCLAVAGYSFAASVMVAIVTYILIFMFMVLASIFG